MVGEAGSADTIRGVDEGIGHIDIGDDGIFSADLEFGSDQATEGEISSQSEVRHEPVKDAWSFEWSLADAAVCVAGSRTRGSGGEKGGFGITVGGEFGNRELGDAFGSSGQGNGVDEWFSFFTVTGVDFSYYSKAISIG